MDSRHFQTAQTYDLIRFYYRGFCQVTRTTNQTIPNDAYTLIAFDATVYDLTRPNQPAMHSNTVNNYRINIRTAGVYILTCNISWAGNSAGYRHMFIGTNTIANIASQRIKPYDLDTTHHVTTHHKLNAGDFVYVYVYQNTGGNLFLQADTFTPRFSVALIGD